MVAFKISQVVDVAGKTFAWHKTLKYPQLTGSPYQRQNGIHIIDLVCFKSELEDFK